MTESKRLFLFKKKTVNLVRATAKQKQQNKSVEKISQETKEKRLRDAEKKTWLPTS